MKNNIKTARENKGLTQQECADIFGVKLRAWQTYEQGVSEPKYELLCKIADTFSVTTDYLLGREPLENPVAGLNITVDNKKFIDIYQELPELQQQLLVDAMMKLGASAEKGRAIIAEKQKLGTIEDDNTENKAAHEDAG